MTDFAAETLTFWADPARELPGEHTGILAKAGAMAMRALRGVQDRFNTQNSSPSSAMRLTPTGDIVLYTGNEDGAEGKEMSMQVLDGELHAARFTTDAEGVIHDRPPLDIMTSQLGILGGFTQHILTAAETEASRYTRLLQDMSVQAKHPRNYEVVCKNAASILGRIHEAQRTHAGAAEDIAKLRRGAEVVQNDLKVAKDNRQNALSQHDEFLANAPENRVALLRGALLAQTHDLHKILQGTALTEAERERVLLLNEIMRPLQGNGVLEVPTFMRMAKAAWNNYTNALTTHETDMTAVISNFRGLLEALWEKYCSTAQDAAMWQAGVVAVAGKIAAGTPSTTVEVPITAILQNDRQKDTTPA